MKTIFTSVVLIILLFLSGCNSEDCSLVDCVPGDYIRVSVTENGLNILMGEENPTIEFKQEGNVNGAFSTVETDVISLEISNENPYTLTINQQMFVIETTGSFTESECCGDIYNLNEVMINGISRCSEGCNETIEITL